MRYFIIVLLLAVCTPCYAQSVRAKALAQKQVREELQTRGEMPRHRSLRVGDKGMLYDRNLIIVQVVDSNNAIARLTWEDGTPTRLYAEYVWLACPTSQMVDDQKYSSKEIFEADATKTYMAKGGQTTIIHLSLAADQNPKKGKGPPK